MAEQLFTREGSTRFLRYHDTAKGHPQGLVKVGCGRCGGAGRSDRWAHTGFTCYDCGGSGTRGDRPVKLYTAAQLEKLNATRAKVQAKKAAAYQVAQAARLAAEEQAKAERAAEVAADPLLVALKALVDAADPYRGPHPFLADMWRKAQVEGLTEGQRAAVQKFADRAAQAEANRAASAYIGAVGERIEFAGQVESVRCFWAKDFYGREIEKAVVTIRTREGAALTWFSPRPLAQGQAVTGKGTVKEHREYRGEKQTVIQRAKLAAQPAA